jgi:hypothetical protein
MNIYALKGFHVYENEIAQKYLELDKIYTIDRTEVRSSSTKVYLEGIEEGCFNSCFFEDVKEQSTEEDQQHLDYDKYN